VIGLITPKVLAPANEEIAEVRFLYDSERYVHRGSDRKNRGHHYAQEESERRKDGDGDSTSRR
jgi:hypothetical protein